MGGGSRKLREVPGNRGELSEGATSPMEGTEFAPWKQEKKNTQRMVRVADKGERSHCGVYLFWKAFTAW